MSVCLCSVFRNRALIWKGGWPGERNSRCLQVRQYLISCKATTFIYVCKFRIPSSENENHSAGKVGLPETAFFFHKKQLIHSFCRR